MRENQDISTTIFTNMTLFNKTRLKIKFRLLSQPWLLKSQMKTTQLQESKVLETSLWWKTAQKPTPLMIFSKTFIEKSNTATISLREKHQTTENMNSNAWRVSFLKTLMYMTQLTPLNSQLPCCHKEWLKTTRSMPLWLLTEKSKQRSIWYYQGRTDTWCQPIPSSQRGSEILKTHSSIHFQLCLLKMQKEPCNSNSFNVW